MLVIIVVVILASGLNVKASSKYASRPSYVATLVTSNGKISGTVDIKIFKTSFANVSETGVTVHVKDGVDITAGHIYSGAGTMLATAFTTNYPLTGSFSVSTRFNPSIKNVTDALIAGGAMFMVTSVKAPAGSSGEIYLTLPQSALKKYKKVIKGTPKRITVIPRPAPTMLKHLMVESWPVWVSSSSYPKINHTYSPPPYYLREVFYCIRGSARLTTKGMKPVVFQAGDMVIFPKGLVATWTILSEVTKHYMEFPTNQ